MPHYRLEITFIRRSSGCVIIEDLFKTYCQGRDELINDYFITGLIVLEMESTEEKYG